jgi:hypothetical protein
MGTGFVIIRGIGWMLETAVRERTESDTTTVVRCKRIQSRKRLADVCCCWGERAALMQLGGGESIGLNYTQCAHYTGFFSLGGLKR